ncbi:hypothetical protein K490DRAFT_67610 [Saccharata proteae CBS 121410]|uniref:Uncharacterized protein n=1 Tax=Saccharata proteae CBS 121410 TaxID=1314787 RepID=A0A9P4HS64_9PEZI|nr:hypothetical protein K490DRAFT_67610 [Saccharata proteae CBS 121410]
MAYQHPESLTCGFCHQESTQSQSFFSASPAPNPDDAGTNTTGLPSQPRTHFGIQYSCATCNVQRTRNIHYQLPSKNDAADDDRVHTFELIHTSWPAGRTGEKFVHFHEVVTAGDFGGWSAVPRKGRAGFGQDVVETGKVFGVGAVYKMVPAALAATKGDQEVGGEAREAEAELEGVEGGANGATGAGEGGTVDGEPLSSEKGDLLDIEDWLEIDFGEASDVGDAETEVLNGNGKRRRESDSWSLVSELLEEKVDPTWEPSASKKSKAGSKAPLGTDAETELKARPARKRRNKKA